MIKQEDIIADLHTHTINSLHAHSTMKENVDRDIGQLLRRSLCEGGSEATGGI